MKRLKWVLGTLLLAVVPVLAWVGVAHAQHIATTVPEGQTIYSSVYSAGRTVDIKGTIYGDVYCAGATVKIDADVHGDVLCTGDNVTVDGKVDGSVRLAGQTVTISGNVTRNASVAAMTFSLDAQAKIGQDLTVAGGDANVKGSVARDLLAAGKQLELNGPVARNVKASTGHVQLKDGARVGGDFTYNSHDSAEVATQAHIDGATTHELPRVHHKTVGDMLVSYVFALITTAIITLALALVFPRFVKRTSDELTGHVGKSLVTGIVGAIGLPLLVLAFTVTLVGIPLAGMLLVALLLAGLLAVPIAAYHVGERVMRKESSRGSVALAGTFVVVTAYHIPFIGLPLLVLVCLFGFGGLLRAIKPFMHPAVVAKAGKK